MTYQFNKPAITFKVENPQLIIGNSLTWVNLEVQGNTFIRITCPETPGWKPIYFWIRGSKTASFAAPINNLLVAQFWYFLGLSKKEFKVDDSDWQISIPSSRILKQIKGASWEIKNWKLNNLLLKNKIFLNWKLSSIVKINSGINTLRIKSELSRNLFNPNLKNITRRKIFIKQSKLNPGAFYKNQGMKDE